MLGLGLVMLGLCVFAWGLRYKLSLYDAPHSMSTTMPAAKLLAGKDRSWVSAIEIRRVTNPEAPLALTTLALSFFVLMGARLFPGFTGWAPGHVPVRIVSGPAACAAHFIRPPPRVR
ncbi:MAG TPA: hypothetical protein VHX60_09835 [Acidobacteriaceae bacterium]|jgi:hypothetical protein|nr:hypothetical protein [Acidobacteriaceae bacterium]